MENKFLKKVELVGVLGHPENNFWSPDDYSVSGAMGCFAEESSTDIHQRHSIDGELYKGRDWEGTKELLMKETSGRGHGAVLDKGIFSWSIDNLTRESTLFLCGPQYASHLQQSLRRASAEKGFREVDFDSEIGEKGFREVDSKEGNKIMEKQFRLYDDMKSAGIPTEDSRIILPLKAKTTIDTTWDARELMHLDSMAKRMNVSSDILDTVRIMYEQAENVAPAIMKEREKNLEVLAWMPSNQLYAASNIPIEEMIFRREFEGSSRTNFLIDYSLGMNMSEDYIAKAVIERDEALLANLKHTHFTFMVPMSLMSFHQATRQRTWDQSVEPLEKAVVRGSFVMPQSIRDTRYANALTELSEESRRYVLNNIDKNRDVIGVIPHNLEVYDMIHVNGWNALHSIGKRKCTTAQWEIRNKATIMGREIKEVYPALGNYCLPQGMIYGSCPERENCGKCKK
ncbi:FAD-dependent thymidylate synthase [Candidatus Pacearchaeota archaeon]|nr:FAD-dependent thymidylate synthase [Candidatus Pacearchaeota archaeon]